MSDILNEILEIATFVKNEVVEGTLEVRDFALEAVEYESSHIAPQFLQLTADCMAAAEQAFIGQTGAGMQKYMFAWTNVVAACKKDGLEFFDDMYDACVQYVIAERNRRRDEEPAPVAAAAAPTNEA